MTTIVGIDPGISGAIAVFVDTKPACVLDLPTMLRNKTGNAQQINGAQLARMFRELVADGIDHAYLELVTGQMGGEKMGNSGAFQFGRGFGAVEQAVVSASIPLSHVSPAVWKKRAGLIGAEKDASRTLAIQRWPQFSEQLKRKKDVGRAEAMLIAFYGSSLMERAKELERADPFELARRE